MLLRPFHRWKSFWLGVLVLAFLGWGWIRSMSYTDGFFWILKHDRVSAWQSWGQLGFAWDGSKPPSGTMFQWIHETTPAIGEPLFPRAVVPEIYDRQFQFSIAHWFTMLLFVVAWTAFLWWRIRRSKRFVTPTPPEFGSAP